MICHNCGYELKKLVTSLPFKISNESIVIIRGLSVMQCSNCGEYLIADDVMAKVDTLLNTIDRSSELEILKFPA